MTKISVEAQQSLRFCGRVWIFGDEVNTDDMYPGFAMRLPVTEATRYMFSASRPGWPEQVSSGDIIVGGLRFGLGSSRPVPLLLKELGVAAVIAEEISSLFLRNCINYGFPACAAPGVTSIFKERQRAILDLDIGMVKNADTATGLEITQYPEFVLEILRSGGVIPALRRQGLLKSDHSADHDPGR
jgi:3-isopropylmalate/(R)-2-methylmalate dehydratase small subunit